MLSKYAAGNRLRFTLVELMMVIAIIGAIAALGLGVFNFSSYKIAETRSSGVINKLDAAIKLLNNKYGMYPQNEDSGNYTGFLVLGCKLNNDDNGSNKLVENLRAAGALKNFPEEYVRDFINLTDLERLLGEFGRKVADDNGTTRYVVVDSWDRPLFYHAPGNYRTGSFDLCSAGLDGKYFDNDSPLTGDGMTAGSFENNLRLIEKTNLNSNIDVVGKVFFSSDFSDDITNY
ncbi:MAG: prepilin-type N-terminal cleavage/methylation domain-containing protein [Victivallaceae bacterium]|nr:prepilin-type N-terminal cleavage/methylation domain-containing protein [Victivallaceae bacterium]